MKKIIIFLLIFIISLTGCNTQKVKDCTDVFTIKEAKKISNQLLKIEKNNSNETQRANIKLYIGEYNEAYVIVIQGPGGIPEGRNYVINGYQFHEHPYDLLIVFYKNDIYSLKEAYELSVISREDLDEIYLKYTKPRSTYMLIYSPYDEYEDQFLLGNKYDYIINSKDIPYIIASNNDGSIIDYWYYDSAKMDDAWVNVRSSESLITEEQKEILRKYIPSI